MSAPVTFQPIPDEIEKRMLKSVDPHKSATGAPHIGKRAGLSRSLGSLHERCLVHCDPLPLTSRLSHYRAIQCSSLFHGAKLQIKQILLKAEQRKSIFQADIDEILQHKDFLEHLSAAVDTLYKEEKKTLDDPLQVLHFLKDLKTISTIVKGAKQLVLGQNKTTVIDREKAINLINTWTKSGTLFTQYDKDPEGVLTTLAQTFDGPNRSLSLRYMTHFLLNSALLQRSCLQYTDDALADILRAQTSYLRLISCLASENTLKSYTIPPLPGNAPAWYRCGALFAGHTIPCKGNKSESLRNHLQINSLTRSSKGCWTLC